MNTSFPGLSLVRVAIVPGEKEGKVALASMPPRKNILAVEVKELHEPHHHYAFYIDGEYTGESECEETATSLAQRMIIESRTQQSFSNPDACEFCGKVGDQQHYRCPLEGA